MAPATVKAAQAVKWFLNLADRVDAIEKKWPELVEDVTVLDDLRQQIEGLRVEIERDISELEDLIDAESFEDARQEMREKGATPWEQVKTRFTLGP